MTLKMQTALSEMGQVDVLIEMMVSHLPAVPTSERKKEWFEKMENALYLLDETYREKKAALISALEGGAVNE